MPWNLFFTLFLLQIGMGKTIASPLLPRNNDGNTRDTVNAIISAVITEEDLPDSMGLSIAFIKDGEIVYKQSKGFASLEYQSHNEPNTPIAIASLAKQFTAYGLALLIRDGKISLNDNLAAYLPDYPQYGHISIRQLVYHTSGIKDQWALMSLGGYSSADFYNQKRILKMIGNQKTLNFDPDTEFLYSNSNYTLLATIIEKVTGERFSIWMKQHVFEPLNMVNTAFIDTSGTIVSGYAQSYDFSVTPIRKYTLNLSCVGPSGMVSSLEDLCLWIDHLNAMSSEGSPMAKLIENSAILKDGERTPYAFGQGIKNDGERTLFYHDGSEAGYRSFLGRIPTLGLGIIILANGGDKIHPEKLAMNILSRLQVFNSRISKPNDKVVTSIRQFPE